MVDTNQLPAPLPAVDPTGPDRCQLNLMLKVRIRSTGILGVVGLTLVTVSHPIPIAMGYQLVLVYMDADPAGQATLAATADTFAAIAL